jgi:hypothetical protein
MVDEYIRKQDASDWLKQYGQDVLHGKYKFSLMYIWKNLMDLPSADVVQVVHGKWIPDGHHRRCNRCGTYFCHTDREGDTIPNNFCPNCGAKMD